jgi:serine/threonine protein kinase
MSDKFIGQTLAEKYRIENLWRESGLGNIYQGKHLGMEKSVTVKILSPALAVDENIVKRFSDEARTVSHISHPNILNVTDFGAEKDGAVYIICEESAGETLKEAIEKEGKFTPERAVRVARQIASALSVAHAAGVYHRNLNSNNILLTHAANGAEIVKILEFGANAADENESFDEENPPKNLEYRSPEQCSDSAEVDGRSDIYSAGIILYEMLAGEVPFAAEKPTDLMLKHAQEPPSPLAAFRTDLSEEFEPIVLRALAKTPEMRYQTADEFAEELNKLAKNFDDIETVVIPKAEKSNEQTNNIWKTAFITLAGISVLAIGLIYATQVRQSNITTAQTDINGMPVQPLNPATGMGEQGAANLMQFSPEMLSNMNLNPVNTTIPEILPNGERNPLWDKVYNQGNPIMSQQPTGDMYNPNNVQQDSQFMPNMETEIVPANTNVSNQQVMATPTPKGNTNVNRPPSPTPKPTETNTNPTRNPTPNSTEKPENKPTSEKQVTSDKKQDTN